MTNLILKIDTTSVPMHIGTLGMSMPGEKGADGREVELRKSDTHVQWKYVEDTVWKDIIALADLKGEKGEKGLTGDIGPKGDAFTYADFTPAQLEALRGPKGNDGLPGIDGKDGINGTNGVDGKSAYEIAVANGYVGTQAQWLLSLKGLQGKEGMSAYGSAVLGGYTGDETTFYADLAGVQNLSSNLSSLASQMEVLL